METDWGKIIVKLSDIVADRTDRVVQNVLRYTAADVRRAASRSIKSGGRNMRSKNWTTSKPGEPPRSHKGTLKQAIRHTQTDSLTYIVGPERLGASSALKTLEYGGSGTVKATFYDEQYVANRRKSRRKRKGAEPVRPRAKKPYRVVSKTNPNGVIVRDYLYFKNSGAWERAAASSRFQSWASRMRTVETKTVRVEPRPYMRPALEQETADEKANARMTRAIRAVQK